jgi:multidrug transporter EmrE-like cation transporter
LLLIAVVLGVAGQLLLKLGMSRRPGFRLKDLAGLIQDYRIVAGFSCYAISTVLYLKALATLNLSLAYPTVSLGYVLVIIMSKACFKEPVAPIRWIGVLVISVGIALVGLG